MTTAPHKPRILFICGRNLWRSQMAERIYANDQRMEVRSAGLVTATDHRSLFTAHCSLITVHCSLLTDHRSLLTVHCSLFTDHGRGAQAQNTDCGSVQRPAPPAFRMPRHTGRIRNDGRRNTCRVNPGRYRRHDLIPLRQLSMIIFAVPFLEVAQAFGTNSHYCPVQITNLLCRRVTSNATFG